MNSHEFIAFLRKHPEAIANVPMEDIPHWFRITRNDLPYLIHRTDLDENIASQIVDYLCYRDCPSFTNDIIQFVEKYPFTRQRYLGILVSKGIVKDFTEEEVLTYIKEYDMAPDEELLQGASDRVYRAFLDKVITKQSINIHFGSYDYIPSNLAEEYFDKCPQLIKYIDSPSISQIKRAFSRVTSSMFKLLKPSAWNSLDKKVQYSLLKKHIYVDASWLINFFNAHPPTTEMLNHCIDNSTFYAEVYYDIAVKHKLLDKEMLEKILLTCCPQSHPKTLGYFTEELLLKSIEKHGAWVWKNYVKTWGEAQLVKKFIEKHPAIFNSLDERIEQEYQALCKKYLKPQ